MRNHVLPVLVFFCISTKAQLPFKKPNEISPVLSKVIHDYPNSFSSIKGELLEDDPQFSNYACLISIPGISEPGIITQYGEEKERAFSWRNVLLETENFEEAKSKFRQYYAQARKTITVIHGIEIKLVADYTEPAEDKKFNSIRFTMQTIEEAMKDVTVELGMQYEMSGWKITLSVYHIDDTQKGLTGADTDN
jgi:hypothetical protein